MKRKTKSQIWKFEEGDHIETTSGFVRSSFKNYSRSNYYHGIIKGVYNHENLKTQGSMICFLDEETQKLILLKEINLKKYDGTPKRFVNGDLITNTTIEDILK